MLPFTPPDPFSPGWALPQPLNVCPVPQNHPQQFQHRGQAPQKFLISRWELLSKPQQGKTPGFQFKVHGPGAAVLCAHLEYAKQAGFSRLVLHKPFIKTKLSTKPPPSKCKSDVKQTENQLQKSDLCSAPQGKKGKVGLPSPWSQISDPWILKLHPHFCEHTEEGLAPPCICKSVNISLCSHTAAEKQRQKHKTDESSSSLNFTQLKAQAKRSKLKIAAKKKPHKTLNFSILI